MQTQKQAVTQDAGPPLAEKKTVIAPPEKSVSPKELPTDGDVFWRPPPEAMQTQKQAVTQDAGPPRAEKKTEVAPLGNAANPIVAEHPPEKPIQPTKSPIAPALAPAPLQTEQMSRSQQTGVEEKVCRSEEGPGSVADPFIRNTRSGRHRQMAATGKRARAAPSGHDFAVVDKTLFCISILYLEISNQSTQQYREVFMNHRGRGGETY